MRVLITGATGFIGRALLLRLRRDHHQVVAWVRDAARARHQVGAEAELRSPADGATALADALTGVDAVVNLAGEPIFGGRWSAARRRRLVASRVDATAALVAALAAQPRRPAVLVSASAVGYYGDRGDEGLTEESAPGSGFLADLCVRWEAAADAAAGLGVRVVQPRIGIVLGPGGGALAAMLPVFRAGLGGPLGSGRQWVPWIHRDDLVEILVAALTDARYAGPVNAVAPEPATNAAFGRALGRALHRPAFLRAPGFGLRLVLGEAAGALLGGQAVTPSRLAALGFAFRFPTLDAALADVLGTEAGLVIEAAGAAPPSPYLARRRPRYQLTQRTTIAAPLAEVFPFFSAAENLGLITPPDMAFRIDTPAPIAMGAGTTIDYHVRVGAVPLRWRTVIEEWEPGRRFVDSQERGPYRSWWHEHRFQEDGDRTVMEDRVLYAPPLGPLGRLANRVLVAPALRRIFAYRAAAIRLRYGDHAEGAAA